jgi:hypothetical protein
MYAALEIQNETVTISLLHKALKDERLFHSNVIAGQADGTLIYFDANGQLHVVHGTGPLAQLEGRVKQAVSQIIQGVEALEALATEGR